MAKLILTFEQKVLKEIILKRETFTIGRLPDNLLQIDNLSVSGHHAKICWDQGHYTVQDLVSLTGIYVNNKKVAKSELKSGDQIFIGKYVLQFVVEGLGSLGSTYQNNQPETQSVLKHGEQPMLAKQPSPLKDEAITKLILTFEQKVLKEIILKRETLTIGRLPDNVLQIDNLSLSGHHAKICWDQGRHTVEDLGSLNGVYVNSQKVAKSELKSGDQILIGKYFLQFVVEDTSSLNATYVNNQPVTKSVVKSGDQIIIGNNPQLKHETSATSIGIDGQRLSVFLCHSTGDKPAVRNLYQLLRADGFAPWLDEEDLLAGQNWQEEIRKAVRASDCVIVCLSKTSVTKEGYIQREIKFALDVEEEKLPGTIFIIPLRLEEVDVPERLQKWHWADLFKEEGYGRLTRALKTRAQALGRIVISG
ncbi:MAG TPA: FHA domain-containing protein, partial [Candidatus Angelobacter sp.]|nr:FHA domain-containing protein [Candidatus Angelobacter sp.]